MSRRQHAKSSSGGLIAVLRKDQFGTLWLSLLFLAVLISKWYVVSPLEVEGDPCVECVIGILWLITIGISLLITGVWWAWTTKAGKGIALMFVLPVYILGCTLLADYVARRLIQKLYYSGFLYWPEAHVSYLVDDMVRHSMGLFLATAVIYGMIRLMICKDLEDKKIVIPVGLGIALATGGLMLLGIKFY